MHLIPGVELNICVALFSDTCRRTRRWHKPASLDLLEYEPVKHQSNMVPLSCQHMSPNPDQSPIHADVVMELCEGTACQETRAGWRATSRRSSAGRELMPVSRTEADPFLIFRRPLKIDLKSTSRQTCISYSWIDCALTCPRTQACIHSQSGRMLWHGN